MRYWWFALLGSVVLTTTGCASSISHWIVQTRSHQGDVALAHGNYPDASVAYQLALKVDPTNAHARAGLVDVQTHIAGVLFATSRFEEAVEALAVTRRFAPDDEKVAGMRSQIEQAEIKRDIVVSNYPNYKETGTTVRRALVLVRTHATEVAATLQRFDYTYDSSELTRAIRDSYVLNEEVTRITNRLIAYRQLVDSGVPESAVSTPIAPPASLLPLP